MVVIVVRIERIGHNKIKVILSLDDLQKWDINIDDLSYGSPQTQEMFWNMLKRAEVETGFYVDNSQLIVEARPLPSEGFVITVTRVEENDDFESIHKYIKNKFRRTELRVKKKTKMLHSNVMLYLFHTFEDACHISSLLNTVYTGESKLYKYKDFYYLSLISSCEIKDDLQKTELLLNEYGEKVKHAFVQEGFLNEYATLLIDGNAIQTLSKHF